MELGNFPSIRETSVILQGECPMSTKNHISSLFLKPKSIFFAYIAHFCYFHICTHASKPRIKIFGKNSLEKIISELNLKYEL